MVMRENIKIIAAIIILFLAVFLFEHRSYFQSNQRQVVQDAEFILTEADLEEASVWELNGKWSFYPDVLIPPTDSLEQYEANKVLVSAPHQWNNYVKPNAEGVTVGTYHIKIHVPRDDEYGFYIKTIHQANRIFINGEEVGGIGNPSQSLAAFEHENDDKYVVFGKSEGRVLDLIIHVGNHFYPKAGILYPIEFGEKKVIQKEYLLKLLLDGAIVVGYIVFGLIYFASYIQNRKRKEELFFGLFAISLGLYMSLINQKWFFLINPGIDLSWQLRMQLGMFLVVVASWTYFLYSMFPQLANRKIMVGSIVVLGVYFLAYTVFHPFQYDSTATAQKALFWQYVYVSGYIFTVPYNIFVLIKAMLLRMEGAKYILIILTSFFCYITLLGTNFLMGVSVDYLALLLFFVLLFGFASLLSYRANWSYEKVQRLSEEMMTHNQMKDEFLLKTSHELRTPLNGILNVSKLLMEGAKGPLKRAQQENVMLIYNVTKRLEHLVEDLLFSSNYMTGEVRVSPHCECCAWLELAD
ncbi:hypothetical protein CEW92_01945 [Bacillaceae bacterium SAS-127]|nr:hypothetical protein CEW92_01945 [Bacillaceae bacterium SAS-127]